MFQVARTFKNPTTGGNVQRGFPAPGSGDQVVGEYTPAPPPADWTAVRPTKGKRTFFPTRPSSRQRGFPSPESKAQQRPDGSMPNKPVQYGRNIEVWTPYYDRGAAAYVQNYGKILTNPIGGGVVAPYRTQASYGQPATYADGALWWTSQAIPTSVNLQGLTNADILASILSENQLEAVVRISPAGGR